MGAKTCTTFSGTLRISASRAAQSTANVEAGEPSTPTTIAGLVDSVDIDNLPVRASLPHVVDVQALPANTDVS